MTIEEIKAIIKNTQDRGKGFEVTFIKRTTGETRVMRVSRPGMTYGFERDEEGNKSIVRVNGKGMAYKPEARNLLTVREMNGGFRNIPLDAIISLRVPDDSKHLVGVPV